ncbi:MAG TPA: hydrogenase maturation protease [Caldilineaceae bacterium]|nr:hydrogenase maturation protease [Caldilineaceae bacterium]
MDKLLVIGYGNTLRRDDGAGVALAARLVRCWQARGVPAQLLTVVQLTPELSTEIADGDVAAVFFVDTRAGKAGEPVQVQPLAAKTGTPGLGHQLEPTVLLAYARLFSGREVPAWLLTVPGVDFGHGEGFSPDCEAALAAAPALVDELAAELARWPGSLPPAVARTWSGGWA